MEERNEIVSIPPELQGHNYRVVYFTPSELSVDMTVDETKVVTLINSIRQDGKILEPIFVWVDGAEKIHIINGMHRTYSAQKLSGEMKDLLIPAVIIDCSEETFRAARVIAASPHIAIKESRINDWIRDAWSSSEFGKDASATLLSSAYGVYQKKKKFSNADVQAWFERNSNLWGIHIDALAYIVLGSYRTEQGKQITNQILLEKSVKYELSIEQHATLCEVFPRVGRKGQLNDESTIEGYIRDVIIPLAPGDEPVAPIEYVRSKISPAKTKHRMIDSDANEEKKPELPSQELTIQRWAATANGSKNFVEFLSTLLKIDFELLFEKRPHTRQQITEVLSAASVLAKKVNGDVDPSVELFRLREELNAAKNRIGQLETINRELSRTTPVSSSALVLSSTDIEGMS